MTKRLSGSRSTRKFGKERFSYHSQHTKKKHANLEASKIRARGKKARITRNTLGWYEVWKHG